MIGRRISQYVRGLVQGRPFGWFTPQMFGARGDGLHDDTAAIQAAIAAAGAAGGGVVFFPQGTYRILAPGLVVSWHRVHLVGAGQQVTVLVFEPDADDQVMIDCEAPASAVLYQTRIAHLSYRSADTTYRKVAFRVTDVSRFVIEDVAAADNAWIGNGSVGLAHYGRELNRIMRCTLTGDVPLLLGLNPNWATLAADVLHIEDIYTIGHSAPGFIHPSSPAIGNPNILVEDGTVLSYVTMDGANVSAKGAGGIYWKGSAAHASEAVEISNYRWEQAEAAGFIVHADGGAGRCHHLLLKNVSGGALGGVHGFYLRDIRLVTLIDTHYKGTGTALDVDAVDTMHFVNARWQDGSAASVVGLEEVFAVPQFNTPSPLPWTAHYELSTSTRGARLYGVREYRATGTLADDGSVNIVPVAGYSIGQVQVSAVGATQSEGGVWLVSPSGGVSAVKKIAGTANTADANVDTDLCVFWTGSNVQILNRLGEAVDYVYSVKWA